MYTVNPQEAQAVERHIKRIFESPSVQARAEAVGRLFVEELDFRRADRRVSLAKARGTVTLPTDAHHVASLDTAHVIYIALDIRETDRIRKAEAAEAAKVISRQLDGDLLLVFTNSSCSQLHLIYPTFESNRPTLRRMVVERNLPRRTAVQQITNIYHQWQEKDSIHIALESAFDVEAVTRQFFTEYKRVFDAAMEKIGGFGQSQEEKEDKRLYVQTLFNRLMFVYFLSRKGWLTFREDQDYLNALWKDYADQEDQESFFSDRLYYLFFFGLNNQQSQNLNFRGRFMETVYGSVPFLNGGLFEKTDLDKREGVVVPDDAIEPILTDLFDRFNFTVMESTPFDIEVAVDPEMLGKVFEELVTGRHESGSYYTPRPVVAFMCREALKGYLAGEGTGLSDEAIANFVDTHDTSDISITGAQELADALKEVTVVDPACGSGAYLLGMMQELIELQTALFSDQLLENAQSLYDLKLQIIQRNLYGVDIDPFATNIAMLRLWLALAIDFEGERPEPLPNLDFKIICGNSLLGPDPDPENQEGLFKNKAHAVSKHLSLLKDDHLSATGAQKEKLAEEIGKVQDELKRVLVAMPAPTGSVDWRVEYAEVFDQSGGFDIVVANPPYVRQEQIGPTKAILIKQFSSAAKAQSDLYCYFYARGIQLLRAGGMHVFVCSNSWLDVGYGAKLQEYLLKNSHVRAVYESAIERQFSTAQINTIISIIENSRNGGSQPTKFISLRDKFERALAHADCRREITASKAELWEAGLGTPNKSGQRSFVGDKWGGKYLRAPDIYRSLLHKNQNRFIRLGEIARVRRGVTTGANKFFLLDGETIERWGIETAFLRPIMKSPQESLRIEIDPSALPFRLFSCHLEKEDLAGTSALEYIEWGEAQKYNSGKSMAARHRWYDLGHVPLTHLLMNKMIDATSHTFLAKDGICANNVLYEVHAMPKHTVRLCGATNSTICQLILNVEGRANFGGGMLEIAQYELARIPVVNPELLPEFDPSVFSSPEWSVLSPSLERRLIDDAVFDVLRLTQGERDAVYEGVTELVENRRSRAKSV